MKEKKSCCKKTSIGGQALIEGVMMRGPHKTAMANRMPDGTVDLEYVEVKSAKDKMKWLGWPFIRGVVNMVESMILGYRTLMRSAEKAGIEEEEPGKFEQTLNKLFGDKLFHVLMAIAMVLGVGIALLLFMWLPVMVFNLINKVPADLSPYKGLIEGVVKIIIFLGYVSLVSLMKDIRRVFQYHGAEHKTIFCYEAGEELTVENVRKQRRFHPRCGTSFLVLILVVSILLSSAVLAVFPVLKDITWLWVAIKILLLPVICAVGYELIKMCGRSDGIVSRIVAAPGLWVQRITTKEPDDSMIEVAIASLQAVIPENAEDDRW